MQGRVKNNLKQAGFANVQIMPSSFLVQARDMMVIPVNRDRSLQHRVPADIEQLTLAPMLLTLLFLKYSPAVVGISRRYSSRTN